VNPIDALWLAHDRILRASVAALLAHDTGVLLDIGAGAFVVETETDQMGPHPLLFVVARTWLPPHLGSPLPRLPPARDVNDVIGSFWACPPPLREYRAAGRVTVPDALIEALAL
jgi:hypothetical protein